MKITAYCVPEINPIIQTTVTSIYYPHVEQGTNRSLCKLKLSCGGGIGGSYWEEYVYVNLEDLTTLKFVEVFDPITELTHIINTNNIVEIIFVHGYRLGYKHENPNFNDELRHQYYFEGLDADFEVSFEKPKTYTSKAFIAKPVKILSY